MKLSTFLSLLFLVVPLQAALAAQGDDKGKPFLELQSQIDNLQSQIDALQNGGVHVGPYTADVDCFAGDSINAALASAPPTASSVRINLVGTCTENVVANRSSMSIWAAGPGAGISVTQGLAFLNPGFDRVRLIGLNIHSDGLAIRCRSGSIAVFNSTIVDSVNGILATAGCSATLQNSTIDGGAIALNITENASLALNGVTVKNTSNQAMLLLNNATARLSGGAGGPTTFKDNFAGITVGGNATLLVGNAEIDDNDTHGIQVSEGSYIRVTDGAYMTIRNNGGPGLSLSNNSTAAFWLDPQIEISGNSGAAVSCDDSIRVGGSLTQEPNVVVSGAISPACPPNL